ncbi:MAG: hypothetical protein QOJ11_362 [Frankiales bacterium]|jgi:hypothetical protein|nr:hypothetical protein [Frankiales bacterium]
MPQAAPRTGPDVLELLQRINLQQINTDDWRLPLSVNLR